MAAAALPLLVVLTGPTGSGKSELALQLAARLEPMLPLEIISADSALVYHGMDIGTAKPSPERRARVPHHLIDIRDPAESYSAGEFVRDARAAIADIHARGRQPLLVGGTMLYLRALYHGLAPLPPASSVVRQELEAQAQRHGWPALHGELARVDPAAAARIAPGDAQRIQRALEVHRLTGVPISRWQQDTRGAREQFRWLRYALLPADEPARAGLRARLAARFAHMLEAGLVEEVRRLHARGDLTAQHASMRAVGYRQLWRMFAEGTSLAEAQRQALIATAQLAKRQLTWLRREPELIALSLDAATRAATGAAAVAPPQADVGLTEALAAEILAACRA
ncbi:MAG TPA: tRNA (adenosine(37)-N6)-dimethylallyltransferase MiaA [Steroidobacteraceae bacterium]|jgi:tRNA dimethylallyltransferase|nr:tRNA (adenosine(37)-N6)-dimethylallyltransferase MiaA [Steroidobacteraceae bacterium]